jgi:uncharacterized protein (TIGR03032 family)
VHTQSFTALLRQLGMSLAVTTYQAGKLILMRADGAATNTHFRIFDKPMGLAVAPGRLALGSTAQVWDFRNIPAAAARLPPAGKHDACYLPRALRITGDIDIHELAWVDNDIWFVNTRFSCLCTLDPGYSFVPRWRPPFIKGYDMRDLCHLNGLAVRDGRPRYVTALGESDQPGGWRARKADGGILIDIDDDRFVARNLSMPHSPRWYRDRLWVLESGKGSLAYLDAKGVPVTVAELPGFTRGLDFHGDLAFIGLSQVRETAVFAGLPLTRSQPVRHCGVWVVDIRNGQVVAFLRFESGVQEIFAVALLPHRFPDLIQDDKALLGATYVLPDAALSEAVQPSPDWEFAETHFAAANRAMQDGQADAALAGFRKALALRPDLLPARFALGVTLGNLERYEEALAELEQVIAAEAGHAEALNSLGFVLHRLGEAERAIACLERAVAIRPDYAEARANLDKARTLRGRGPR